MNAFFWLSFFALACKTPGSPDHHGILFQNKGITCDGILDESGQTVICGESSVYTATRDGSGDKDAFLAILAPDLKTGTGYSFGQPGVPERFEQVVSGNKGYWLEGFYGESKNKFLIRVDALGKTVWASRSERFQTFDEGHLAVNRQGEVLLATKDPSADAYQGFIHFFNAEGRCAWSRQVKSMEGMQDILVANDQSFILSFRQKGAYIDAALRKKYMINSFYKISREGQLLWSKSFHFDREQSEQCEFQQVLQDPSGAMYFIGRLEWKPNQKQELYVVKTLANGEIQWSKRYSGTGEWGFKSAALNAKGHLILLGDGYAKKGGLVLVEIQPDGLPVWSKLLPSSYYDQAIQLISLKNGYGIVWDKLLNFAFFDIGPDGGSCFDEADLKLDVQNVPLLINESRVVMDSIEGDWKPFSPVLVRHETIALSSNCP
ncbi:MAG TPA: hypothetical protein VFX48_08465 [Saprospiraceae bacterium]|nr:hypothetical protein [Saprospiraceae bacterium]